jgi:hypothetical protein
MSPFRIQLKDTIGDPGPRSSLLEDPGLVRSGAGPDYLGFLGRVGASTREHLIGDPALCFGHLGRGEPERGADVLGADLDAASALARVGLPRALV